MSKTLHTESDTHRCAKAHPRAATTPSAGRDTLERLGEQIAETAACIDAATHRLLAMIRQFDEAGGWYAQGAKSCAEWLAYRIGLSPGAAREQVRVARALGELPALDAALGRGALSYAKARAVTRVATPENEATLLELALHMTGGQLEKTCRLLRQSAAPARSKQEDEARRGVFYTDAADGAVVIEARLLPDEAAIVMKAIDACRGEQDRATGLVAAAELALGGGTRPHKPVDVSLTIDAATLVGKSETGQGLGPEVARRLCCDAGIAPVLCDAGGAPLDVGRRTRSIPPALRRALLVRDGGCRFPGCTNTRFVDAHHLVHWIDGGPTSLGNTALLCSVHHRDVHEHGYRVEGSPAGELVFRDPQGRRVDAVPSPPQVPLAWELLRPGLIGPDAHRVSAETNQPRWDGFPIDYEACLDAVLGHA